MGKRPGQGALLRIQVDANPSQSGDPSPKLERLALVRGRSLESSRATVRPGRSGVPLAGLFGLPGMAPGAGHFSYENRLFALTSVCVVIKETSPVARLAAPASGRLAAGTAPGQKAPLCYKPTKTVWQKRPRLVGKAGRAGTPSRPCPSGSAGFPKGSLFGALVGRGYGDFVQENRTSAMLFASERISLMQMAGAMLLQNHPAQELSL